MKKLVCHFFLIMILGQYNFGQKPPVLNLISAMGHPEEIVLSDFIESITYIPLSTTYDCLVDKNPTVYVTKELIITVGTYGFFVFNRSNGEFLREIRHYGRGPAEYRYSKGLFNEGTLTYYFTGWNGDLVKYTVDGNYGGNIRIPDYNNSFDSPSLPMNYSFINDSVFICDFLIGTGIEPKSFMLFNEKGKVLKIVPNWNRKEIKQKFVIQSFESNFYHFNNNLFFQNIYNDTVFKVTSDDEIIPYIIVDRGKHCPPFESKWWTSEDRSKSDFISLPEYFESKRYLIFNFNLRKTRYIALYDKSTKSLKVNENFEGVKNDVDGFMDITFNYENLDGELIGLIEAKDLVKWIDSNLERFANLKIDLIKLKNVQMEDNPIIVIAKFKM